MSVNIYNQLHVYHFSEKTYLLLPQIKVFSAFKNLLRGIRVTETRNLCYGQWIIITWQENSEET